MVVRFFISSVMTALLAGCATTLSTSPATSSPSSTTPPTTPTTDVDITPLDWLREKPFEPMPSVLPEMITIGLPEGFSAMEPGFGSSDLPDGHLVQVMSVEYQRPVGDQVYIENVVTVQLFSYDSRSGRSEHLDILEAQGYEWSFSEVSNQRVTCYRTSGADGRVWISGPFLIVVFSGLDTSERGPWVDPFTEVYLAQFPQP